ncbi:MAG: glycosyltransferase, partial [Candidatus Peribacteraceae bacterium]
VKVLRVGFGFSFDKYLFPLLAPLKAWTLQPAIIHAVLESYAGAALVLCKVLMPRTTRVLTLQSTNTSFLLGPMHRSANTLTAISRALIDRAKRFGREDVVLIPNGIDLRAIRSACADHAKIPGRVLFVGRLERMKGIDVLLSAFARMVRGLEEAISDKRQAASGVLKLHIVGDGSLRSSLEAQARSLKILDRVTFTGHLSREALYREYAEAEIFSGLSRSEALGNVFLEAQAAGCAIVATRVGGIMDIVENGSSGLLVLPDDVASAAGALSRLLSDPELRSRLALKGAEGKEAYDWGRIAQEYAKVLEKL